MATEWREKQPEWKKEASNQGWAIKLLEDELKPKSEEEWLFEDQHKCLLYLALTGKSIESTARLMGWKKKTVTSDCSKSIYKAIGYLKNPDCSPIESIKWNKIVETCLELGFNDLYQNLARENEEKRQQLKKFKKLIQQGKIKIDIINCSEEERAEIEELIRRLLDL